MPTLTVDLNNAMRDNLDVIEAAVSLEDSSSSTIIIPIGGVYAIAISPNSDADQAAILPLLSPQVQGSSDQPIISVGAPWTGFVQAPNTSTGLMNLQITAPYRELAGASFGPVLGMMAMLAEDPPFLGIATVPRLAVLLYLKPTVTVLPTKRATFFLRREFTANPSWVVGLNPIVPVAAFGRRRLRLTARGSAAGTIELRGLIQSGPPDGPGFVTYTSIPFNRTTLAAFAGSAIASPVAFIDVPINFDIVEVFYEAITVNDDLRFKLWLYDEA